MATISSAGFSSAVLPRKPLVTSSLLRTNELSLFGLKSSSTSGGSVTCMATYNVKLITPSGERAPPEFSSWIRPWVSFECDDDVYILDKAEEDGYELPYSCRAGSCSSCAGKVVKGAIDQADGSFLDDNQIDSGWVLTFVAYPTSDVVIETHKEEELTA